MNLNIQYIAGFLDGEGCIQMVRQRSQWHFSWTHRLSVCVTNTYEPIVKALHQRYGGVFGSRDAKNGRKRVYYWHASGNKAKAVLIEVMPYLIEKKPQAELALEYLSKKSITSKGSGRVPLEEIELRDKYYWALRKAKL